MNFSLARISVQHECSFINERMTEKLENCSDSNGGGREKLDDDRVCSGNRTTIQ